MTGLEYESFLEIWLAHITCARIFYTVTGNFHRSGVRSGRYQWIKTERTYC